MTTITSVRCSHCAFAACLDFAVISLQPSGAPNIETPTCEIPRNASQHFGQWLRISHCTPKSLAYLGCSAVQLHQSIKRLPAGRICLLRERRSTRERCLCPLAACALCNCHEGNGDPTHDLCNADACGCVLCINPALWPLGFSLWQDKEVMLPAVT